MTRPEPSALSRTLSTPIGDLLGGRAVPRSRPEEIIRRADLPQSLAAAIHTVVRRTRLWRSERADVAAELTAHFRDALDAGRTPAQALGDFGSLPAAAALIRRAKKRNRALIWRLRSALAAALGWTLLALLGVYAFLFVRYLLVQPNVARNYIAEINAPILAIPEADRAWPHYREAYLALTPLGEASSEVPGEGDPPRLIDSLGAWRLPPPLVAEAREYVTRNAAALDAIRAGAAKPALGLPVSTVWDLELVHQSVRLGFTPAHDVNNYNTTPSANPWLFEVAGPELPNLRALARLLATDTRIAAEDADADRAAANIEAMLGIAGHLRSRTWLIADLVAMAIQALALDTASHVLTDHPALLTDEHATRLAHAIGRIGAEGPLVRFDGERLMFDDTLQRLYSDDGHGNGVFTRRGVAEIERYTSDAGPANPLPGRTDAADLALGPIASAVIADRASTRAMYDYFIDEVERMAAIPLWERLDEASLDTRVEHMYSDPIMRARYPIVALAVPALEHAVRQADRLMMKRDATLTLIAAELHRRRAGAFPATLSQIAPTLLPITPCDHLTGDPLGYTLKDGRPLIYSRGADQDDDGGRPVDRTHPAFSANINGSSSFWPDNPLNALFNGRGQDPAWDGDWVLWPPDEPRE